MCLRVRKRARMQMDGGGASARGPPPQGSCTTSPDADCPSLRCRGAARSTRLCEQPPCAPTTLEHCWRFRRSWHAPGMSCRPANRGQSPSMALSSHCPSHSFARTPSDFAFCCTLADLCTESCKARDDPPSTLILRPPEGFEAHGLSHQCMCRGWQWVREQAGCARAIHKPRLPLTFRCAFVT